MDGVVEDCVSFVGVDLNACAPDMLRYDFIKYLIAVWREIYSLFTCFPKLNNNKSPNVV